MSVGSLLKSGLGATDPPTRPEHSTFAHLEPRFLRSADPIGPASLDSLVVRDDDPKKVGGNILDEELLNDVVPTHFRQLKKSGW